jgi:hypothetical protein
MSRVITFSVSLPPILSEFYNPITTLSSGHVHHVAYDGKKIIVWCRYKEWKGDRKKVALKLFGEPIRNFAYNYFNIDVPIVIRLRKPIRIFRLLV